MRLRADFISLMMRVGEDIDKNGNLEANLFDHPDKITKLLEEKMLVYEAFYEKGLMVPMEKKQIFKKMFLSLRWDKILPLLKKAHLGIEVFFKKRGFGIGIAVLAGVLCEYLVPVTLVNLGLAHLIPFSMMTPWTTMYTFIPGYLNKLQTRKTLVETLGGKIQTEAFLKQQSELLKTLHMHSPNDLIFPIENSEVDGVIKNVVVQNQSFKGKILQRMGWKKEALTLGSVSKFISDNSIEDPYITWLLENPNLDKDIKTGMISSHLFNLGSGEIEEKFQKAFADNIILLKNQTEWDDAWTWVQMMKKVKNVDELLVKIKDAPTSLHPKELAILWENIFLPDYAIRFDLTYSESRRAFDLFTSMKAKLMTSESEYIDDQVRNELFMYLKKISLGRSFKGCQNVPEQIAKYLLKGIP